MIGFEFKKAFIKQYGLILIALLAVLKLFSSAELFKPDTGALTPQQRVVYLEYMDEYGGVLTDEKEAGILETYALLTEAKSMQQQIQDKLQSGEYTTTDEYFKAMAEVPEIISDRAAIEKLYRGYESVVKDREHRVLLSFDAPAMTVGQEYWLLIFICYISAMSIYYERKISNLQKASANGKKTYAAKLLAVFAAITAVWLIFSVIEFFALTAVVSKANLSASLASLESFKETPYSDMTILGGFWAVEAVKLVGYLFTAAVTLIIARISGNLVLSIFSPVALNYVWIYLFSDNTAAFYQPFALMRGAPYLTGTHYLDEGNNHYVPIQSEIPREVFAVLFGIAVVVIAISCALVISSGNNKLKKRNKIPAIAEITMLTMLLAGCSSNTRTENCGSAGGIVQSGDKYYARGGNVAMLDSDLNVLSDSILRDVFETERRINSIFADGNYLYCCYELDLSCYIDRVDLTDFSKENVYFGDYSYMRQPTKYFDMITAWDAKSLSAINVKDFFVSGGKLVMTMENNAVYSIDLATRTKTYLFEDVEVNNLCTSGGKIYYTNMTGELICFENGKKSTVSDRIFKSVCADGNRIYGVCSSGVFGYDSEFNETEYSVRGEGYWIRAYNERIAFKTYLGEWVYIDENGEHEINEADDVFVFENGLIIENNGTYSFYK